MNQPDPARAAGPNAVGIRRGLSAGEVQALAVAEDGFAYPTGQPLSALLALPYGEILELADAAVAAGNPVEAEGSGLPPVDLQEVWASGVTYQRSKEARIAESDDAGDAYAKVYDAERPELFFKAAATRVTAPGMPLRIRRDSSWDVPEPELALVLNAQAEIVGYLVGNDMSSRSIEAENTLYLPQAKIFDDSLGLSETIALERAVGDASDLTIALTIHRGGVAAFAGRISTKRMHRRFDDLSEHLFRELSFPHGAVLLTGTGLVPPDDFTLAPGDEVVISVDGVGTLRHGVYRARA